MPRRTAASTTVVPSLEGQIKWLPKKEELEAGISGLEDGCYNHPVVILSKTEESDGTVLVLIVSQQALSRVSR